MARAFFPWLPIAAFLAAVREGGAFARPGTQCSRRRRCAASALRPTATGDGAGLDERHFQLEEREDGDAARTAVWLRADRTVALGATDGPRCATARGTWSERGGDGAAAGGESQRLFEMNVTRTFAAESSRVGEFAYSVERTYRGTRSQVGSALSVSGDILDVDEVFGERQVGVFSMIDTSEERERDNIH